MFIAKLAPHMTNQQIIAAKLKEKNMSFRKWSEAQNDSIKIDSSGTAASPSAGSASAGSASAGGASAGDPSAGGASADDKQGALPAKQPSTDDKL